MRCMFEIVSLGSLLYEYGGLFSVIALVLNL